MFDYSDFQQVFPAGAQLPYSKELIAKIEQSRKTLDGVLFVDRVLKALGLTKAKTYPPKSDAALRQLHQHICDAPMSLHHKFSLLYYVLLDFDEAADRSVPSESFVSASGMPSNYQIFIKGLWHLDRKQFPKALEYVAHPSLTPDFSDEILTALIRHGDDIKLALAYYHTVRPILKSSAALELLFDALAQTSVTEALLFTRTFSDYTREALFRRLVKVALDGESVPGASEIALLPFEPEEETWFEEYLRSSEGRNLRKAEDTLLVRKITGDHITVARKYTGSGQWGPILAGIRSGTEGQDE
ncbi:unnamed protein product [Clonostachys byssicola]|uniref:ELYS-like domain-containing protein n=1 Tax=Clonostachys byssicola TaxID=160290 RepID=A0A9N9UMI9_9HYPO|nr:unnamed protein product [Clonostachys byssicola]